MNEERKVKSGGCWNRDEEETQLSTRLMTNDVLLRIIMSSVLYHTGIAEFASLHASVLPPDSARTVHIDSLHVRYQDDSCC